MVVSNPRYRKDRVGCDSTPKYLRLKPPEELNRGLGLVYMANHKGSFTLHLRVEHASYVAKDLRITTAELLEPFVQAFRCFL
jgi:hypothetical protein